MASHCQSLPAMAALPDPKSLGIHESVVQDLEILQCWPANNGDERSIERRNCVGVHFKPKLRPFEASFGKPNRLKIAVTVSMHRVL